MAHVYSIPVDDLVDAAVDRDRPGADDDIVIQRTDVVIVGSGYGASVAALQIAGLLDQADRPIGVTVLERGREYAVGEFPNILGELPGHIRFRRPSDPHPSGNPDALFDLRIGEDTDVLLGNGLGGGSLINANVAARPDPDVLDERWPDKYRNGGLDPAFDELERLLGVNTDTPDLPKHDALKRLADSLGRDTARAGIAVTQRPPDDAGARAWRSGRPPAGTGIVQAFCSNCGNCVTGCNVGAKNTLMMNLIPLAAERGARFVTGANVLTVERPPDGEAHRWRLRLQRTRSIRTPLEDEHFFVHADYVILAAGALGSTEILQRSADMENGVRVSSQLGRRFSCNGDGVGFSFGQVAPVNAQGTGDIHGGQGPGPAITGIVRGRIDDGATTHPFTLEEAAIPGSLVKLFGELITTGAMLGRIGRNELPGWFDRAPHAYDPLAYNPDVLPHSQMLLMMTDDRALRRLELSPAPPGSTGRSALAALMRRQTLVGALADPVKAQADAGLTALDARLAAQSLNDGFDRGQYVTNPLWRLLPEGGSSALGGTLPGGRSLTVHPLGGCAMADSAAAGVVDADCRVYSRFGPLLDGLYVMDGSVLPGPLATNPFLTIAAVAWQASRALVSGPLAADGWRAPPRPRVTTARPGLFRAHPGNPGTTAAELVLREQMIGRLISDDESLRTLLDASFSGGGRLLETDGMILRVELDPFDVHERFALRETASEIDGRAELYVHPAPAALLEVTRPYGAPPLADVAPVAEGRAWVSLLELDAPGARRFERCKRTVRALWAYLRRRSVSLGSGSGSWWQKIVGFWRVAQMHADYRQFRYRLKLRTAGGTRVEFVARKKLRWRMGEHRVWDALLNLPVERVRIVTPAGDEHVLPAHLRVDAGYLLDEGLIQAAAGAHDMTETVTSTLSFLAWFGRCLLHTGFWEFGSPAYPKREPAPPPPPSPLIVGGGQLASPVVVPLPVGALNLELVHYPQAQQAEPVLLVHGLAQGSGIFNTLHMKRNMAASLWDEGYDVWLLDYRLSNRLDVPLDGYAIDAIGIEDIPAAVTAVYERSGHQPLKVFAHCVGAIGVQMALLRGRLRTPGGAGMVESVCFNAIHPWVVPAAANLVRLKVGAFARAWISDDLLDPILRPADGHSALRSIMDRLAFSLARIGEGGGRRFVRHRDERHGREGRLDNGICDRMTFFYGRMWRHGNLEKAVHAHWHELVGPAPAEVYQQLYYLIERQCILNDAAENEYLRIENILEHWRHVPTLFIHGDRSDVFSPYSATRSAIRLNKVFRDFEASTGATGLAPVRLRRYPGMGHMDPILGRDAHQGVFQDIASFFAAAHGWHADASRPMPDLDPYHRNEDPTLAARIRPEAGPVVRAAWIGDSAVEVRYWVEQYRYGTARVIGTLLIEPDGTYRMLADPFRPEGCEEWFQWFDLAGSDVLQRRIVHLPPVHVPGAGPGLRPVSMVIVAPRSWSSARTLRLARTALPRMLVEPDGSTEPKALRAVLDGAPGDDAGPPGDGTPPPWFQRLERRRQNVPGADATLRLLVGSCRYPGTPMERDNADAVFAGMRARLGQQEHDLVFFVGDQIYADAYASIFQADGWREVYQRSYVSAFNSRNMAQLLKAVPVHFAIDDHEIVDDYSGGVRMAQQTPPRTHRGQQDLTYGAINSDQVRFAFGAALRYLSSAREAEPVGGAAQPAAGSLWYALDHRREVNFPCFVLDTRRERELRAAHRHHAAAEYPTMLSSTADAQLDALLTWLSTAHAQCPDRPKLVFAGQIVAPVGDALVAHPGLFRHEDGFFGYPATLRAIARRIAQEQIHNVVFVGGDLHFSCAARIELDVPGYPTATVWQIIASGLYAPMVFANGRPADYTWLRDGAPWVAPTLRHAAGDVAVRYRAEWLTTEPAHFVEVDVAADAGPPWVVTVRAFDRAARPIAPGAPFDETAHQTRLRFA